jgi:hypothetical protein
MGVDDRSGVEGMSCRWDARDSMRREKWGDPGAMTLDRAVRAGEGGETVF